MIKKILAQKTLVQFVKFGLVGLVNTAITLGAIFFCMKILEIPYLAANFIGYTLGLLNSFLMNRLWTFKSKGDYKRQGFVFLLIFGVCYLLQLGFLILLKEYLKFSVEFSQIIAMITYTVFNFIGNKFLTFKPGGKHDRA